MDYFVLTAALLTLPGQATERKLSAPAAIGFLQKCQAPDGHFTSRPEADQPPSLRTTTAAIRALGHFGGRPTNPAAAKRLVEKCFHKDSGGFSDAPDGRADVISTAVGLMAVAQLKLPAEDYRPSIAYLEKGAKSFEEIRMASAGLEAIHTQSAKAATWIAAVERMRNPDGTYGRGNGTARDTGSVAVTILRLRGKLDHQDKIVEALKKGQRPDGGFGKADAAGSDLETTYRVMRAFHMLKEKPDADALKKFLSRCQNLDGGFGITIGQPSQVGPTYFAASVLHWLEEP
jgi:prenyltransferase beta subunit